MNDTRELTRALLKASAASLVVAAGIAIVGVLSEDFNETTGRVALTTLAIALYNATGSAGVSALANPRIRSLGIATVCASAVAFLLALGAIWSDAGDETVEPWGMVTAATLALAQAAVYLHRARPGDPPSARTAIGLTVATGGLLAVIVIGAIAAEDADGGVGQLLGVLAVLNALGMALTPILRRLGASAPGAATSPTARGGIGLDTTQVRAGDLERELEARVAQGAAVALGPIPMTGGGRLAAVRRGDLISVLVEAG